MATEIMHTWTKYRQILNKQNTCRSFYLYLLQVLLYFFFFCIFFLFLFFFCFIPSRRFRRCHKYFYFAFFLSNLASNSLHLICSRFFFSLSSVFKCFRCSYLHVVQGARKCEAPKSRKSYGEMNC